MKAVFLDRDGVINVDHGYVSQISDFQFHDKIIPLLQLLKNHNYELFICTNQSGIARNFFNNEDYKRLTLYYLSILKAFGVDIKEIETCPHHPDYTGPCDCRKPLPGMFDKIILKYDIDCQASMAFGDNCRDLIAAKSAGINRLFLISESTSHDCKLGEQRFNTVSELYNSLNELDSRTLLL
jgi:D-glycero-D-manno-heptose 1,7-bisphosphate phosphatase